MTGTYGDLQARIADELIRSDLTSQIKIAILSAITTYQRERFYFNESRSSTFSTVAGQEFYTSADLAAIPNLINIDTVLFYQSPSYRYPLDVRTWDELELWSLNPNTVSGFPSDYAYYAQQLRLYPIPSGVYTVRLSGVQRLTPDPLSADSDTNAWMTDGEELIRQRAKGDLLINTIRDPDYQAGQAQLAMMGESYLCHAEKSAYLAVRGQTTQLLSSGRVRATQF